MKTYKDYVEKYMPEFVDESFDGFVKGCPTDERYSSLFEFKETECPLCDCGSCWNRECTNLNPSLFTDLAKDFESFVLADKETLEVNPAFSLNMGAKEIYIRESKDKVISIKAPEGHSLKVMITVE